MLTLELFFDSESIGDTFRSTKELFPDENQHFDFLGTKVNLFLMKINNLLAEKKN